MSSYLLVHLERKEYEKFNSKFRDCILFFAHALIYVHFWTWACAKEKKEKILFAAEILNFSLSRTHLMEQDFGGNSAADR